MSAVIPRACRTILELLFLVIGIGTEDRSKFAIFASCGKFFEIFFSTKLISGLGSRLEFRICFSRGKKTASPKELIRIKVILHVKRTEI